MISNFSAVDSWGAGGARAPPEFGDSEKGRSLISAYRSLAITTNTPDLKSYLSTALNSDHFHKRKKYQLSTDVPKKTNQTLVHFFIGLFIYMLLFLIAARSIQAVKWELLLLTRSVKICYIN